MLRQLDSCLWVDEVEFSLMGVNFGNRMTCIQLSDGSLLLHSPTKFRQSTYDEIIGKGKIKYLIAPNVMHNLFIMDWKERESAALVLAPSQAKKLQADLKLNEMQEEKIVELFSDEISCIPIKGIPALKECVFIHHASKTLILTDLAFNQGDDARGLSKLFWRLYGAYNKFGPTVLVRSAIKDKAAFKVSLAEIMSYDFDRIIVSHGGVIDNDGKKHFSEAFEKYL